jgi:hypothetical protein
MNARIEQSGWGSITVDGVTYKHDVLIRPDGIVARRKKKLSKQLYGTSHKISRAEAEQYLLEGVDLLLIGSGLFDRVRLSAEAAELLAERGIRVKIQRTPLAVKTWNLLDQPALGLFHLTC